MSLALWFPLLFSGAISHGKIPVLGCKVVVQGVGVILHRSTRLPTVTRDSSDNLHAEPPGIGVAQELEEAINNSDLYSSIHVLESKWRCFRKKGTCGGICDRFHGAGIASMYYHRQQKNLSLIVIKNSHNRIRPRVRWRYFESLSISNPIDIFFDISGAIVLS